jgi:hypothetical protein
MAGEPSPATPRIERWMLWVAFLAGASMACIAAGAATDEDVVLWIGVGLLLALYGAGKVADALADTSEPQPPPRARLLAGVLAFVFVAVAAAIPSGIVAIFAGSGAFRWMAVCLPLAAAWLLLSGAVRKLARRIARGRSQSHSRAKSTS